MPLAVASVEVVGAGGQGELGRSAAAGPRSFELDVVGGEPGWLRVCDGELVVDLPGWFRVPWRLAAGQIAMIEWWSRTRAVFRARLRGDDYQPDFIGALRLPAPGFREPDLAIWLPAAHAPSCRACRRPPDAGDGVPQPVARRRGPPFHSGVAATGVDLAVREDPLELKRILERWGAAFPTGGAPS